MQKEIFIKSSDSFINAPQITLVPNDVHAYKIVLNTPYDLTDATFKVTAKRADGAIIEGVGTCAGNTAYYTLANNMYSQGKEVFLRLTLISPTGQKLTEKQLKINIAESWGEADISGDDRIPALDALIINITDLVSQANTAINDLYNAENELTEHIEDEEIHVTPEDKIEWDKISEVYKGEVDISDIDTTFEEGLYKVVSGSVISYGGWLWVSTTRLTGVLRFCRQLIFYPLYNTLRQRVWDSQGGENGEGAWSAWENHAFTSDLLPILQDIVELQEEKLSKAEAHQTFANAIIGTASGETVTLSDVQEGTSARSLKILGETTETGEGEKKS